MINAAMKASLLGVVTCLALSAATPLGAQESGTIIVEGQREKPERKICKSTAPMTGTRLGPRRVCRSDAEWKALERRSQQLIETQQQRQRAVDAARENAENALAKPGPL